ncbi:MAG: helix-turn-helix transcriptional regulator, partial [Candidatus Binataceae bacterium]
PRTHQFEPYTLLAYRGGLYLLGRSDLAEHILYLAVERIRGVSFSHDQESQPIHFILPRGYDPARYTEGTFGLVSGDEAEVEILLLSGEAETYLRSRAIHPSQQFQRRADGHTVLTMKVRGTVELKNWVMGFGPWLEVLKPEALRQEIAGLLNDASAIYAPPAGAAANENSSSGTRRSPS